VPGYNATRSHNTSHLNYQHTTKGNTVTKVETVVLPIPQGVNFRLKVLMSLIKVQILTKSELTLFAFIIQKVIKSVPPHKSQRHTSTGAVTSLFPGLLPDFVPQPWRKTGRRPDEIYPVTSATDDITQFK